jgi:hypothetical protein
MVGSGKIKIEISRTYPLQDAARPRRHRIAQDYRVDRPGGVTSATAGLTCPLSLPGLTRQSIPSNEFFRWMRRSSPRMTS